MKKVSLLIVIAFACVQGLKAQWINVYSANVNDISFPSESVGYMTFGPNIKKTTDGGQTWTVLSPGAGNFDFTNVQFLDENVGFAGKADDYTIAKTVDGGATWTVLTQSQVITLSTNYPLQFIDVNTGYRFLKQTSQFQKTSNGGLAWTNITLPSTSVTALNFINASTGFVVSSDGAGRILMKTTDGGASWTTRNIPFATGLTSCDFVDENIGYVAGRANDLGIILKTTDGGANWTQQSVDYEVKNIKAFDASLAVAVGFSPAAQDAIWQTTDGTSWTKKGEFLSISTGVRGITFASSTTVFAAGGSTQFIAKSTNGGNTWQRIGYPQTENEGHTSLQFVNENIGYSLGNTIMTNTGFRNFYKTTDGGFNWQIVSQVSSRTQEFCFSDASVGYSVTDGGGILKTENGGLTWTPQTSGVTSWLTNIDFSASTGIVVGANGVILKTANGGTTWTSLSSNTTTMLTDVALPETTTAVVVGYSGTILTSTDLINWTARSTNTTSNLQAIHFPSPSVGFAVGDNGKVLKSVDGGTTWSSLITGSTANFNNVFFSSATAGYISGESAGQGVIYATNDGGSTWVKQTIKNLNLTHIVDVDFPTNTRGIAVASYGTSPGFFISLCANPSFTASPQNQSLVNGETLVLSATVNGNGTLHYQWQRNGVTVGGDTPTLTVTNVQTDNAGNYTVTVTDGCGTTTSAPAVVTVLSQEPGAQPTSLLITSATSSSISFSFTAANGADGYLVIRQLGAPPTENPSDATLYSEGSLLGTAKVIYSGAATTFTDNTVSLGSVFHYRIFSYKGSGTNINYQITNPLQGTSLSSESSNHVSNLTFSEVSSTSVKVTFGAALDVPDGYTVVRKKGSAPISPPIDGNFYNTNDVLGDGIVVSVGTATSFTDTNLNTGSEYYYVVFPFRGNGVSANHLITASTSNVGSVFTKPAAPAALEAINVLFSSFTARWDPVTGGDKYKLEVSIKEDFSELLSGYNPKETTTLIQTVTGMKLNTRYYYRVRATNISGDSEYSNTVTLKTENAPIGTTALQVTKTTNNATFPDNELQQKASVTLANGLGARSVVFYYKGIAATTFQSAVASVVNQDEFEIVIEKSMLDDMGLEFYWEATDIAFSAKSSNQFISRSFSGASSKKIETINLFGGTLNSYQIFSIPLALEDNLIESIFNPVLGAYDDKQWRLVRHQNGGNVDFPTINRIELGKSYWFNSRERVEIRTGSATAPSYTIAKPFTMRLDVGWNQIATPFPFAIDWDDVLTANNSPAGVGSYSVFTPSTLGFSESNVLQPYSGGFVFADRAVELSIPVTIKRLSGGREKDSAPGTDLAEDSWLIPFSIRQGEAENNLSGVGMNPNARVSKDDFDEITLPRFLNHLEFNSYHDEYFAKRFTKDVVPTTDEYTWKIRVESSFAGDPITLDWSASDLGNSNAQLLLIDRNEGIILDMRKVKRYTIFAGVRDLEFFFSRKGKGFHQEQSFIARPYPNPSVTQTSFDLFSQQSTEATIVIMDMMGRVHANEKISLAGGQLSTWHWNGAGAGKGVFIYRISQRDSNQTYEYKGTLIRH